MTQVRTCQKQVIEDQPRLFHATLGGALISSALVYLVVICAGAGAGVIAAVVAVVYASRSASRSKAEWRRLAGRFPARKKVSGIRYQHRTAKIGEQAYTALITFYSSAEGLYIIEEGRYNRICRLLRLGHAALCVEWDDIHPVTIALAFEDKLRLDLGEPSVASFEVAETFWGNLVEDRPPTGRSGDRSAPAALVGANLDSNSGSESIAASPLPAMPPLAPSELPNYFSYRRREVAKSWLWRIAAMALNFMLFGFVFVGAFHGGALGFTVAGIAVVLWGLSTLPFVYVMSLTNRMRAPSAKDILARDARAPVLSLRSFDEDSLEVMGHVYEEDLVEGLQPIGPAIAIGRPGEPRPALGAARFYVEDQHWQEAVLLVLKYARAVVLQVGARADWAGRSSACWGTCGRNRCCSISR